MGQAETTTRNNGVGCIAFVCSGFLLHVAWNDQMPADPAACQHLKGAVVSTWVKLRDSVVILVAVGLQEILSIGTLRGIDLLN